MMNIKQLRIFKIQLEVKWLFTTLLKSVSAVILLFPGSLDIAKKTLETQFLEHLGTRYFFVATNLFG